MSEPMEVLPPESMPAVPRLVDEAELPQQRDPVTGRFAPGNTVAKGKRHREQAAAAARILAPHRKEILQRLMHVGFTDDGAAGVAALRTLAERAFGAVPKVEDDVVEIPAMREARSLGAKAQAVLDATAEGDLSPGVAKMLLDTLATVARVEETAALVARLDALEARLNNKGARP